LDDELEIEENYHTNCSWKVEEEEADDEFMSRKAYTRGCGYPSSYLSA
jgi:hypothetical protein